MDAGQYQRRYAVGVLQSSKGDFRLSFLHLPRWKAHTLVLDVLRSTIYRVDTYDSGEDDWLLTPFVDLAQARQEFTFQQVELGEDAVRFRIAQSYVTTEKMASEGLHDALPLAFVAGFAMLCFIAHNHPHFDGLWWADDYDPDNYSCPRGMISPVQLREAHRGARPDYPIVCLS
jgi:hypothetical protein